MSRRGKERTTQPGSRQGRQAGSKAENKAGKAGRAGKAGKAGKAGNSGVQVPGAFSQNPAAATLLTLLKSNTPTIPTRLPHTYDPMGRWIHLLFYYVWGISSVNSDMGGTPMHPPYLYK